MVIIKKYKVLLVLTPVVIVGTVFFFYRMYNNDVKALTDFSASYEKFNSAMSDFSSGQGDYLESKANNALVEFNKNAAFRLSSLIKNDSVIPPLALEIADFSGKELQSLKAYKSAVQNKNADLDKLAKQYSDMSNKRKAAYVRFQGFAGMAD